MLEQCYANKYNLDEIDKFPEKKMTELTWPKPIKQIWNFNYKLRETAVIYTSTYIFPLSQKHLIQNIHKLSKAHNSKIK